MSEALTERIITPMSPALVASIDDYRFANRVPSRAEAMRTLLQRGLAANDSAAGPRPLSELVLEYYTADPDRVEEFQHPDIATAEQAAAFDLNAPKRKSHRDYEALLRRYVRPALGSRPASKIEPLEIQGLYADMQERGLSARTVRFTQPSRCV